MPEILWAKYPIEFSFWDKHCLSYLKYFRNVARLKYLRISGKRTRFWGAKGIGYRASTLLSTSKLMVS